jgi:hypothetical protein
MVWGFAGADPFVFTAPPTTGFVSFLIFAHRAFCACAIFLREAAEITRAGWFVFPDVPVPFSDSITEIAWSSFSTCDCALLRSHEAPELHWSNFPLVPPWYVTAVCNSYSDFDCIR